MQAICDVHRGSDGPWTDPVECAVFVNHRLLRPFHCRVAERGGRVVGHAEWIIDWQPSRSLPILYLGLLQVRSDSQRQGVGRSLIEDGLVLAAELGCDALRTVPDEDAVGFYERCGFARSVVARSFRLPVRDTRLAGWRRARSVPARASRSLPFRLGWVQASSAHMWEICNRPALLANETWYHPSLVADRASAYVQIRHRDASQALVVAWADFRASLDELTRAAQALAATRHVESLLLATVEDQVSGGEPAGCIFVLERPVFTKA